MSARQVKLGLLTHMFLALVAASGALSFVFQTRYMGLLCPLVVLLVPLISIFLWIYNKTQKIRYADKIRRYVLGLRIAAITGWCLSLLPGLFWGAILFHIFEPWPFSLSQGPDTVYAIEGFKKVLGFEPSAEIDQIFYKGYEIRDYDRYLRFHTCDNAVEEIVVHDLEKVNDGSNVAAHHLNERLSWWFEIPEAIELEHWREEFRVIWLDRRTCTFYVRSWTT